MLLGLHVAAFAVHHWWPIQLASHEWPVGGSVLASQPAGLWLLIAVFTLQVGGRVPRWLGAPRCLGCQLASSAAAFLGSPPRQQQPHP